MTHRNLTAAAAEHASRAFVEDFERRAFAPPMSREQRLDHVIRGLKRNGMEMEVLRRALFGRFWQFHLSLIRDQFRNMEVSHETNRGRSFWSDAGF